MDLDKTYIMLFTRLLEMWRVFEAQGVTLEELEVLAKERMLPFVQGFLKQKQEIPAASVSAVELTPDRLKYLQSVADWFEKSCAENGFIPTVPPKPMGKYRLIEDCISIRPARLFYFRAFLIHRGIRTLEQLSACSEDELWAIHGIGEKTMLSIREALASEGLFLGTKPKT